MYIAKHSKKLDKYIKYTVAAILLMVPLFPKFPFISVPGTFVSIRIEDFLLVFASILLTIKAISNLRALLKDKISQAIILYIGVGLISLFSAIFVTKTIAPHIGFLHWVRRIEYFVPFFIGLFALGKKENLEFYLKVLMVSIVIVFIYGVGQKYFEWPIIITQNLEYSRGVALRYVPGGHINSTFAGHYDLSTFLVLTLPILISLFVYYYQKTRFSKTTLLIIATVTSGLWLLSNSGSRISVVSYLLSASFALFLTRKIKFIPIVVVFSLMIFSFSPSLRTRYLRIFDVATDKVQEVLEGKISNGLGVVYAQDDVLGFPEKKAVPTPTPTPIPVFEDRSTSIRVNVEWPRAIRALSKNPLLGTGYSSITLATDSDYLRLFGEVGIIGFFAFILIFVRIGKLIYQRFPLSKTFKGLNLVFLSGIVGSMPGIFINASFIDVFEASKFAIIFWLLMGMAVSTAKNK